MTKKRADKSVVDLDQAAVAAQVLLANYRDIINGDETFEADLLEGETNFFEAVEAVVDEIDEAEFSAGALKDRIATLNQRKKRLEDRAVALRGALLSGLETAKPKGSLKLPVATITLSTGQQTLEVDPAKEADIPSGYWITQPPKLDKKALLDDLKGGATVAGATLQDGKPKLTIRRS